MYLTGPLYATVLRKLQRATSTGTTTQLSLIQQRVCVGPAKIVCPPHTYHVGIVARSGEARRLFEHGPIMYDPDRPFGDETITIPMPSVRDSIEEIEAFEKTLQTSYVLGYYDCRHRVLDLLTYLYDPPLEIPQGRRNGG
jgi:hypothetical protein